MHRAFCRWFPTGPSRIGPLYKRGGTSLPPIQRLAGGREAVAADKEGSVVCWRKAGQTRGRYCHSQVCADRTGVLLSAGVAGGRVYRVGVPGGCV